jgi:2-keto-4-pentenoate hydratase/2-oxohepta-3-ene-1,7-dioic acid hydratase in catechol pathway
MSNYWVRFKNGKSIFFGRLEGEGVRAYEGDMFSQSTATDQFFNLSDVVLLMPVVPTKIIALWNNFFALTEKLSLSTPTEPLYLIKAPNSYLDPHGIILQPEDCKVVYEGELGIVIGKTCKQVTEEEALDHVFGYTCANDVTAANILNRDASFTQWVRAKGFDTFCPFGPVVATDLDPTRLTVKTILNGEIRQNYPVSDMRFSVQQLVSLISKDMTLFPGDIILCGTSVGVGSMKPGSNVEIDIAGIGKLCNRFESPIKKSQT